MWIVIKTSTGTTHVCQTIHITEIIQIGDAITLLTMGSDPAKLVNNLVSEGIMPDVRYVQAFLRGNNSIGRPAKRVICNETGEIFESINKASRAIGGEPSNMSNHLRFPDKFKSVKGKTFKYYSLDNVK